jgi:hypothetical protein
MIAGAGVRHARGIESVDLAACERRGERLRLVDRLHLDVPRQVEPDLGHDEGPLDC